MRNTLMRGTIPDRGRRGQLKIVFALTVIFLYQCWTVPNQILASGNELDSTFGSGGKVVTDFFGNSDEARDIVIQPDGKIIAAGSAVSSVSGDFAIARYNNDGSLDSTFGTNGMVTTDFSGSGSQESARAITQQPDSKIIVVGTTISLGKFKFAMARYNNNGSIDSTFGSDGKVITGFLDFADEARAIALQADGKIIVAGSANTQFSSGGRPNFAVARFNNDGSLDSTFGTGGKVTTDFFGFGDRAYAVAIQPDGKIIVTGSAEVSSMFEELRDFAIVRYNSDGSLDMSFGSGGKVTTDFFGQFDEANDVLLLPDGKFIAAGVATDNSSTDSDFGMARYNNDGSLDPAFGSGGKVTTDFSLLFDVINDIALKNDGKILAAGLTENTDETLDFALACYNSDGSIDTGFGTGGKITTDFFGFHDSALAVAIQADGKAVVAGRAAMGITGDFALARYNAGPNFDLCLQDDSKPLIFNFNSDTGEYQFTDCGGFTIGGTGTVKRKGGVITLSHFTGARVSVKFDTIKKQGTASLQTQNGSFSIIDRNTSDNSCSCP